MIVFTLMWCNDIRFKLLNASNFKRWNIWLTRESLGPYRDRKPISNPRIILTMMKHTVFRMAVVGKGLRTTTPITIGMYGQVQQKMRYHDNIVDHYENPRNVGALDKNSKNVGTGLVGAPACGDVMKLQV